MPSVITPCGGGGGGGGIQFVTYPQDGHWLYVETTDSTGSPNGWGQEFRDDPGNGIVLISPFVAYGDVDEANNGARFQLAGGRMRLDITGGGRFEVCADYNGQRMIRADNAGGAPALAFYGVAPVAQPATPVTLGDVIAALQALGLVA
jgi:hypothetical protein